MPVRQVPTKEINGEIVYSRREATRIMDAQVPTLIRNIRNALAKKGIDETKYFIAEVRYLWVKQSFIDEFGPSNKRPTSDYMPLKAAAAATGMNRDSISAAKYWAKKRGDTKTFYRCGQASYVLKTWVEAKARERKASEQCQRLIYDVMACFDDVTYRLAKEIVRRSRGVYKSVTNVCKIIDNGNYTCNSELILKIFKEILEEHKGKNK